MTTRRLPRRAENRSPQDGEVTVPTESHFVFDRTPVLNHGTGATGLNDDRAASRLIEHVRALEGDVRIAPSHATSESHSETGSNDRSNHEDHGRWWNARRDDSRNDSDRHDHGDGDRHSNSGESNKYGSQHKQATRQISSPSRLPVKCLAQGASASSGELIPLQGIPVLKPRTSSSSATWIISRHR